MFVSDKLIYLQLQKTGCSHIARLLAKTLGGEQIGKHNRPFSHLLDGSRNIIGSIRNPLDWYVSLWGYGCDGFGALHSRLTSMRLRKHGFSKNPFSASVSLLKEIHRANQWRKTYSNSENPALFRQWLHKILDKKNKHDLGERYGDSSIASFAGFMTYRYLYLFSKSIDELYIGSISSMADLKSFDKKNNLANLIIRNEHLEEDFIRATQSCGVQLTSTQLDNIKSAKKTNTSSRRRNFQYYYDEETIELVKSKELLLIEKYGYSTQNV